MYSIQSPQAFNVPPARLPLVVGARQVMQPALMARAIVAEGQTDAASLTKARSEHFAIDSFDLARLGSRRVLSRTGGHSRIDPEVSSNDGRRRPSPMSMQDIATGQLWQDRVTRKTPI